MKPVDIPHSTYSDLAKRMNWTRCDLKTEIKAIYEEHEDRYDYHRIREEPGNRGQKVNHKKIQRIMKKLDLKCLVRTKKYKYYKGTMGKIIPNHLERQFTADTPNPKWVTDITEFKLFGKKLHLSPVLDSFNGEIITYTIGHRPTYSLVSEALEKATKGTEPTNALGSRLPLSDETISSDPPRKRNLTKYVS